MRVFLSCLTTFACATVPEPLPVPLFSGSEIVEVQPLPEDPEAPDLSELPGEENDVLPIEENEPSPESGILVSERRAGRDALYRKGYKTLKLFVEADRKVWTAQRKVYEQMLVEKDRQIEEQKPDWFQKHALELGLVGGFILGTVVTVKIVDAVRPESTP